MTRCPVSVFSEPYRPRRSTAARGMAFGKAAGVCSGMLAIILAGFVLYLGAAVLQ